MAVTVRLVSPRKIYSPKVVLMAVTVVMAAAFGLQADYAVNTMVDYRFQRHYEAEKW